MGANQTAIPDLIELSGLAHNTTYGSGGTGQILGVVDNARYTDGENNNTSTFIGELNETSDADAGFLTIDGVNYAFDLVTPTSGNPVTLTRGDGTTQNLTGDANTSQVAFIVATPSGGGPARYFMVIDDSLGDIGGIQSVQTRTLNGDPAGDDVKITVSGDNDIRAVCFSAGTVIATPDGARRVETIRAGDLVMTMDHGVQPVIWSGGLRVSAKVMRDAPGLRPIRFAAGSLGPGVPAQPLEVSAQHRIMLRSVVAERMFGSPEALIPAHKLLALPGVERCAPSDTHYVHLLLPRHEILFANGAPAESLLLGSQTRQTLNPDLTFRLALLRTHGTGTSIRHIVERAADVDALLARIARNRKVPLEADA